MHFFDFSSKEKIFILLLVFALLLGASINLYRHAWNKSPISFQVVHAMEKFETEFHNVVAQDTLDIEPPPVQKMEIFHIDVNLATQKDFEKLPYIGPVLAQKIIECRNKHGRFRKIDDLLQVKGIGKV